MKKQSEFTKLGKIDKNESGFSHSFQSEPLSFSLQIAYTWFQWVSVTRILKEVER
jgi:hypothetical protein